MKLAPLPLWSICPPKVCLGLLYVGGQVCCGPPFSSSHQPLFWHLPTKQHQSPPLCVKVGNSLWAKKGTQKLEGFKIFDKIVLNCCLLTSLLSPFFNIQQVDKYSKKYVSNFLIQVFISPLNDWQPASLVIQTSPPRCCCPATFLSVIWKNSGIFGLGRKRLTRPCKGFSAGSGSVKRTLGQPLWGSWAQFRFHRNHWFLRITCESLPPICLRNLLLNMDPCIGRWS